MAQSTTEAKYVVAAAAANQAIWLRKILCDLGYKQDDATIVYSDEKSVVVVAKNPIFHGRSKHIKINYHF